MLAATALVDFEEFSKQAARYAPKVAVAIFILVAALVLTRIASATVRGALRRARARPAVVLFGGRLAGVVTWGIVLTIVFSILQLNALVLGLSGVLALIGGAFVASASGISNDIISGFFLASDPDIDVGFRIQAAGIQGVVHDIDFRKTRIVDDDGRLHVIPNRMVENGEWIVLARP